MGLIYTKELKRTIMDSNFLPDWAKVLVNRTIDEQKNIDAKPIIYAHWERTGAKNIYGGIQIKCSNCGHTLMSSPGHIDDEHYCCNCGANMCEVYNNGIY